MRLSIRWCACCLALVWQVAAYAQLTPVRGEIRDEAQGAPLPGLLICSADGKFCTHTDSLGRFALSVPEGTRMLRADGPGCHAEFAVEPSGGGWITVRIAPDPLNLAEVVVAGSLHTASNASAPGAFGWVGKPLLEAGDRFSLQQALSTVAGVTFDSRGYGGSQRIQIRGSALRAPFAVRNIRMYVQGIPFSSPDGTAPLEVVDADDLQAMEVVRGPSGSAWGSGTGGVLLLRLREASPGDAAEHSATFGDFGIRRFSSSFSHGGHRGGWRLSHIYQDNDGYRKQEFNRKHQVLLTGRLRLSDRMSVFAMGTWYTGHWALPGALDAAAAEKDPRQAQPYSEENNAGVYRQRGWAGASLTWKPDAHSNLQASLYGMHTTKQNPYGTSPFFNGYKDEWARGAGGRASFEHRIARNGRSEWNAHHGLEWQLEHFGLRESANDGGRAGDWRYTYGVGYLAWMGFSSWEWMWSDRMRVQAGGSINRTDHRLAVERFDGLSADSLADWGTTLLPRIAASFRFAGDFWLSALWSAGQSNPTIFEQIDPTVIRPGEGNLLHNLIRPEVGENIECGIKGSFADLPVQVECAVYSMRLVRLIVPVTDSMPDPQDEGETMEFVRYINRGSTRQQGVELTVSSAPLRRSGRGITRVDLRAAFTRSHFVFSEPPDEAVAGSRIPGVPLHQLTAVALVGAMYDRMQWSVQYTWMDRLPLDNANLHWLPARGMVQSRLDVVLFRPAAETWTLALHAGVNNAAQADYTSFPNINDSRGRFYNPAPPRNFFAGVRVSWRKPPRAQRTG